MKEHLTRKEFLTATTKSVAAASIGALGMNLVTANDSHAATAWPWPYKTLDTEDVRKRGHKAYYDGGCCYGALTAIVSALADQVGEPYASLPTQMMYFGGGGGAGWGTLCGALNGAAAAINLVVDRTSANAIISELFGWYTTNGFPSAISNDYAAAHVFLVNRVDKNLKSSVSGSVLCHTSVTNWCSETGAKSSSADRAERCARLTGDVVAKAVSLLNDFAAGQFRATFVAPRSVTGCLGCHDGAIGDVISSVKMDCQQCHKENFDHLY